MIAYRAMLDVLRELVAMLASRLRVERRARGTRPRTRALSCWYQALLVLVWYRKREDMVVLAAGFGDLAGDRVSLPGRGHHRVGRGCARPARGAATGRRG